MSEWCSRVQWWLALRGIPAGSGFATSEVRLLMINVVDEATNLNPSAAPTLFVDALSGESAGPSEYI